ncbi:MAG: hypothetical protein RLZZ153_2317 [Pseudomonadota bacterium]
MNLLHRPARSLALGFSLSLSLGLALAQPVTVLEEVVVTATRVPADPRLMPQGVVVITADEIRASGVTTANEAIRWLGGVVGRVDTTGGRDQTLDLRGFGEAASSNVVYLVDGVRQNEGDSTGTALTWIPVDSIDRIEIMRGNGSVLYGEGATGGVIHVITNKGLAESGGSAGLTIGTNATRDARASVRTVNGPWRFQVYANSFETDNHRDNFARQEGSVLARATWLGGSSLWSIQWGAQSAKGGLPGGITLSDFASDPRKSYKLHDKGKTEKQNAQLSGEVQAGVWRMAVDLSQRMDQVDSEYVFDGFKTTSETRSSRASVRGWTNFGRGEITHRFLGGLDAERWRQNRDQGAVMVDQQSDAAYVRHEIHVKPIGAKLYAGLRHTQSQREISGNAVGSLTANNTSWDSGVALKAGAHGEVFVRLGTSFRLPNADEFACYPYPGGPACQPVTLLKPQTSKDREIGYRNQGTQGKWAIRHYSSRVTNEIGYDPMIGNTNFDPTKREGFELEGSVSLARSTDLSAQFASRRAVFRQGDYVGRTVPMVPHQSLTGRLIHRLSPARTMALSSQWVSSQRITDDFTNSCTDKIPSYHAFNARYSEVIDAWTLSLAVNNLTNERFYNLRTRCAPTAKSIYPEAGRSVAVSAQRRF